VDWLVIWRDWCVWGVPPVLADNALGQVVMMAGIEQEDLENEINDLMAEIEKLRAALVAVDKQLDGYEPTNMDVKEIILEALNGGDDG
jgi:hypothetical protein